MGPGSQFMLFDSIINSSLMVTDSLCQMTKLSSPCTEKLNAKENKVTFGFTSEES